MPRKNLFALTGGREGGRGKVFACREDGKKKKGKEVGPRRPLNGTAIWPQSRGREEKKKERGGKTPILPLRQGGGRWRGLLIISQLHGREGRMNRLLSRKEGGGLVPHGTGGGLPPSSPFGGRKKKYKRPGGKKEKKAGPR